MADLCISDIRLHQPSPDPGDEGVIAFATVEIAGELRFSVVIRRGLDGHVLVGYPGRRARDGRRHPYVTPITSEFRLRIEAAVLRAMRSQGDEDRPPTKAPQDAADEPHSPTARPTRATDRVGFPP